MTGLSLGTDKVTFSELDRKYHHFHGPECRLKIDGTDTRQYGMVISNVSVDTTVTQEADIATFTIANAYDELNREFRWFDNLLVLGKEIEVHLGYRDQLRPVFFGYITAIHVSFGDDGYPEIQVTGMDPSFKLMRGRTVKAYSNRSISDIVREIASIHGVTAYKVDATERKIPMLMRKPQNDYQFLHDLAQSINYEFFMVGKNLYFRKKIKEKNPFTTLDFGINLFKFSIEQNLSEQVTGVRVRGWDANRQQTIDVSSSEVDRLGTNTRTGANLLGRLGRYEEVLYLNVEDIDEALNLARAAMNERALRLVTGEATCVGIPEIRAGRYIRLEGLGKHLNQIYYISRAVHKIDESGYETSFTFQGNAV